MVGAAPGSGAMAWPPRTSLKKSILIGLPSTLRRKSSGFRLGTRLPFLSVTTASTLTTRTSMVSPKIGPAGWGLPAVSAAAGEALAEGAVEGRTGEAARGREGCDRGAVPGGGGGGGAAAR